MTTMKIKKIGEVIGCEFDGGKIFMRPCMDFSGLECVHVRIKHNEAPERLQHFSPSSLRAFIALGSEMLRQSEKPLKA